jgi:integrase
MNPRLSWKPIRGLKLIPWSGKRARFPEEAAARKVGTAILGFVKPLVGVCCQFADIVRPTAERVTENGVPFRSFRFHDLRRFHVEFLQSGRDICDLQKRLGHPSVKVSGCI